MGKLTYNLSEKTIQDFVHYYKNKQLNLNPGFQRQSVWRLSDRRKLIDSILQGFPIPSIFLFQRSEGEGGAGRLIYDVVDGKQRLESIFMFLGLIRGKKFSLRTKLDEEEQPRDYDWLRLKPKHEARVMGYKLQIVEVSGDLADIELLFIRINSTGKSLTGQEKRHARYYNSPFLKQAAKLADRHKTYFTGMGILSQYQIDRMKHIELVSELLASIRKEEPINKKTALNSVMSGGIDRVNSLNKWTNEFEKVIRILKQIFPRLKETRFTHIPDFYSLFFLFWKLDKSGCVLTDKQRNRQAQDLLIWFSFGLNYASENSKKRSGALPDQGLFLEYLHTVRGNTDSFDSRKRRIEILNEIFGGLFEKRDKQRRFTKQQRELIWHSQEVKRCAICNKTLTWDNFTIDHIRPWSKAGPTTIDNAQLLCSSCNSRKGNRT